MKELASGEISTGREERPIIIPVMQPTRLSCVSVCAHLDIQKREREREKRGEEKTRDKRGRGRPMLGK